MILISENKLYGKKILDHHVLINFNEPDFLNN